MMPAQPNYEWVETWGDSDGNCGVRAILQVANGGETPSHDEVHGLRTRVVQAVAQNPDRFQHVLAEQRELEEWSHMGEDGYWANYMFMLVARDEFCRSVKFVVLADEEQEVLAAYGHDELDVESPMILCRGNHFTALRRVSRGGDGDNRGGGGGDPNSSSICNGSGGVEGGGAGGGGSSGGRSSSHSGGDDGGGGNSSDSESDFVSTQS